MFSNPATLFSREHTVLFILLTSFLSSQLILQMCEWALCYSLINCLKLVTISCNVTPLVLNWAIGPGEFEGDREAECDDELELVEEEGKWWGLPLTLWLYMYTYLSDHFLCMTSSFTPNFPLTAAKAKGNNKSFILKTCAHICINWSTLYVKTLGLMTIFYLKVEWFLVATSGRAKSIVVLLQFQSQASIDTPDSFQENPSFVGNSVGFLSEKESIFPWNSSL